MFSEYASRFLAQSQSRIGFPQQEQSTRNPLERQRRPDQSARFPGSRSTFQRPGNPYQPSASHFGQFPFASRTAAPSAPLFYSATDDFREQDDEEEHEREVADFYALQRSRRQFGGSRLEESSEVEDDAGRESGLDESGDGRDINQRGQGRGGGIKSSWRGTKPSARGRVPNIASVDEGEVVRLSRVESGDSSKSKGNMVEIGLESTTQSSTEGHNGDEPPDDLAIEIPHDEDPPSIQHFRKPPKAPFEPSSPTVPQETDADAVYGRPPPPDSDSSSAPPTVSYPVDEPPRHDVFWGNLFLISLASLFASYVLVWLHTSAPQVPLGDTVYTTLSASYYLLAVDTLIAVIVSFLWLAVLRSYVRPLVYAILVAVPIILFSFSLYPFISSFRGRWHGERAQDYAMRWFSLIPGISAIVWAFILYRGRHSFGKAIGILEFACRILAANPGLLLVGFASLLGVIAWTWLWMTMFTRVFLGGHLSNVKHLFIIDTSTWFLGLFFVLVYLWTLAVGAGIQRATTAATVSQWYFHRLTVPAPTSRQVIQAALAHATTTLFGTICLSTLLALLIRLPFLILPRRFLALLTLCTSTLIPSPLATLISPLTLTYAAIHSQPLMPSSRALTRLSFLSQNQGINPAAAHANFQRPTSSYTASSNLLPYNLSLLLLRATRFITSLAFGFGAWVSTARQLSIPPSPSTSPTSSLTGAKGSLYAYIVGLIAAAMGWGVLGAMDGVLTGVVDAAVVCWGSESQGGKGGRYCREAEALFGESAATTDEERGLLR